MADKLAPLVVVVSHSHWDREWYLPFETFRLQLAEMVEGLLDLLESDDGYEHFMLDGQTILLEDLLELRRDLEPRLRAQIASGRLSVGPWYVLQDEFLVRGESIVRNLLEGRRLAAPYGGPMPVGYLPDAFGHVAQMPRILRGFGIPSAVLWRGPGDRARGTEWRWRAPGGAEVLCLWLADSYSNAAHLGGDPQVAMERLERDLARVSSRSPARLLLWMNGGDHCSPERGLGGLLAELRAGLPAVELVHGDLATAVARVEERVAEAQLPIVDGELRRPIGAAPVLSGVWSARTWQKRHHGLVEHRLVRVADPFVALAAVEGKFVRAGLRHAWRLLLQCQPHDSICGCSVDAVHDEVTTRLVRAGQVADELIARAVGAIAGAQVVPFGMTHALALANPHPFSCSALLRAQLRLPHPRHPFRLLGPSGPVAFDVIARRAGELITEDPPGTARTEMMEEVEVMIAGEKLPPHGVRIIEVVPSPVEPQPLIPQLSATADSISNGEVTVTAVPGGLVVHDLASNLSVAHQFEDLADRGDAYNFCPAEEDGACRSTDLPFKVKASAGQLVATLALTGRWRLPAGLSRNRRRRLGSGGVGLELVASVAAGAREVGFDLLVDNHVRDHRLRALFSLPGKPGRMITDTPFGWIEREAGRPPPALGAEKVLPCHPMSSSVTVPLDAATCTLGTVGLHEIELDRRGGLYLTILRAVGDLSRSDLSSRRMPAGPSLPVPGAQGVGRHRYHYVLGFSPADTDAATAARALQPVLHPPVAVPLRQAKAADCPLLSVRPASVGLSTVKLAEGDSRIIVRLIGPPNGTVEASLTLSQPIRGAWLTDLDERPGRSLSLASPTELRLPLSAGEVATIALDPVAHAGQASASP